MGNRARITISLAIWLVFSTIVGFLYTHVAVYFDNRHFACVAFAWLHGEKPYIGPFDQNLPGAPLVHVLGQSIFGTDSSSFLVFDYLMLLGFVSIFGYTLAVRQGKLFAVIFVPLYQLVYVTAGQSINGQRDVIASHLGLIAGCFLFKRIEGGSRIWMALAGLAIFFAALFKPTFAVFAGVLLFVDLVGLARSGRSLRVIAADHALSVATMALGAGAILLVGYWMGVLGAFYEVSVVFNSAYGFLGRPSLAALLSKFADVITWNWRVYIAIGPFGAWLWWRSGDRLMFTLLATSFLASIASALMQGRMADYHIAAILPALTAFMANALAWAASQLAHWRPGQSRERWRVALGASCCWPPFWVLARSLWGYSKSPSDGGWGTSATRHI